MEHMNGKAAAARGQTGVHAEIEAFLKALEIPPAKFGRLAVRDPRFVFDLRLGRNPRAGTVARVRAFMQSYQAVAA
jgi:hypothetical protein